MTNEVRTIFTIRLRESERELFDRAARRAGITRSELIRQAARQAARRILAKGGHNGQKR